MPTDLFQIEFELPPAAAAVGPEAWCHDLAERVGLMVWAESIDDLVTSWADSAPVEGASEPGLVLLHGDFLGADERPAALAGGLVTLAERWPGSAAVLLFRELGIQNGIRLFNAGLCDALSVPLAESSWQAMLARLDRRPADWQPERPGPTESDATASRLHAHRRLLRQQVARIGEELIQAQDRLEEANRELTDHMAQLSLLYKFGRELSSARNWDETLKGILQSLAEFVGAGGAALILRSAPDGPFSPRQTYQWEEKTWDEVLVKLEDTLRQKVADGILAPGVFHLTGAENDSSPRGMVALPLEHQGARLGFLLLLDPVAGREPARRHLAFLQAVQVILAEEVAAAQMLDRMREIGTFNTRVLETVRSGIWVLDQLGRTIFCNRAARELLTGGSVAAPPAAGTTFFVGRGRGASLVATGPEAPRPLELLRETDLPELFLDGLLRLGELDGVLLPQLLERRDRPFRGEGQIVRPDGEAVPVLVQTSTMDGRGEGEKWLVLVVEDLREAKKLEAERIRADSLEGLVEMSATLAHEIRNPLMGLSAQAELLAEQLSADDTRTRYLDVITTEVGRINDTINRLLNFVRPYEPRRASVSVHDLADDCLALVRPRAEQEAIDLNLTCDPEASADEAWRLPIDGGQIKQVILNLLLNALDASPAGSEIGVRLGRDDRIELTDVQRGTTQRRPGVVLEVSDCGPGVRPEDRERIFRPFFSTKAAGTGLGLSICRKIVTAHGGEIGVTRSGDRTIFRVLLPLEGADAGTRYRQETS